MIFNLFINKRRFLHLQIILKNKQIKLLHTLILMI